MNRDLTVNLRITTASGENAKSVSDSISSVTEASKAATAANNQMAQSNQVAAAAAQSAASAARSVGAAVASQGAALRDASNGANQYATTMSKLDSKFAELEQGLAGVNEMLDGMDTDRKKLAAADREFLEGVQRLSGGLTSMARSVVLLTAANEDDAASMLKMIARFESVAQAVNGVIGVVQGATKAWQQYAIAAQLAGGAPTALGFAGRVAGFGASAASIIGAGAGLLGGGSLLFQSLDNYANGTNKTYASDRIANSMIGFAGAIHDTGFFGRAGSLFKPYEEAYESQQKTARMEQELADRQRLNRRRDDFARIAGAESLSISSMRFDEDLRQSQFIAGIQDPSRNPNWRDSFQQAYRVNTATATGLEARRDELKGQIGDASDPTKDQALLASQRKELEEVERRINDTARERLQIMQQEAETANRIVASQRESLSQMSRGDTRKLADAIRAADAGDELSQKQLALLTRNNIQGYDDVIRRNQERLIASDPNAAFIYQNQRDKTGVDQLNQNFNVAVNSEMVLKVQAEIDKRAPEWISESMKFITQQVERIKEESAAVIKLQFEEMRRQADAASKAKDGGPGASLPAGNFK